MRKIVQFSVTFYAWPSRGGLVIKNDANAVDLMFLGMDRLNPRLNRDDDQEAEDAFARKLLIIGGK